MKIRKCNNVSFEHKVPTAPLLKIGAGIFNYNDAKSLCLAFDNKFPGHVGYYRKALGLAENIAQKNEGIKNKIDALNSYDSKRDKLAVIKNFVSKLGKEIDVVI